MHSLAQEIVGSYDARTASIGSIRQEVASRRQKARTELKELDAAHKAMAKQQRADLAREHAALASNVTIQLEELDAAHKAMAQQQRTDLTKGRARLASSVASQLKESDAAHRAMGQEQRSDLARGHAKLASSVGSQLKEFDATHKAMAKQQRTDLARGRASLAKSEAQRKSEVKASMDEVAATRAGGKYEWQKLTGTMQAKRQASMADMTPLEGAAPPAAEESIAAACEVSKEETPLQPEEVTPQITRIHDRVFEYLASNPDGTRMTELEQEFGLARIQMVKVIKDLKDENKVDKRELLYFAA